MVTSNLRNYSDEEIISIVDNMNQGKMGFNLSDLKALQAETNNRRLPVEYPGIIADLLRRALQGEVKPVNLDFGDTTEVLNPKSVKEIKNILDSMPKVDLDERIEPKRTEGKKTAKAVHQAETIADRAEEEEYVPPKPTGATAKIDYSKEILEDYHDERYPVLNFLVGFHKFLAWFSVILSFVGFGYFSTLYYKVNMMYVLIGLFAAIVLSCFELLFFYSVSENLRLKMDLEKHLRKR